MKFVQLFLTFFRIGLFTIGGGIVMLPLIEREVVTKRRWITKDEMMECIVISQTIPGVIAITTATYVGKKRAGVIGSVASVVGVVLPSFLIMTLICIFAKNIFDSSIADKVMKGIKACVIGLVGVVVYDLTIKFLNSVFSAAIAIIGFLLVVFADISAIIVILSAAFAGCVYYNVRENLKEGGDKDD